MRNFAMRFWVGVTTDSFFKQLKMLAPKEEVNFWRPSKVSFKALKPGEPFLFKLHSPDDRIVGGGWFVRYEQTTVSDAWETFGTRNGATSEIQLRSRLHELQHRNKIATSDKIGCIILRDVFFFPETPRLNIYDFLPWKKNTSRRRSIRCRRSRREVVDKSREPRRVAEHRRRWSPVDTGPRQSSRGLGGYLRV
jgi:hypothetical protein